MIKNSQRDMFLDIFYKIGIIDYQVMINEEKWNFSPHFHDYVEIFIQVHGSTELYVEKNIYFLQGNEIRIYAPGEIHTAKLINDQHVRWYHISIPNFFFENPKFQHLGDVIFNRTPGTGNVFTCDYRETIIQLFDEAFEEYQNQNPLWEHYAFTAVLKLLCYINKSTNRYNSPVTKNKPLMEVVQIINREFATMHTVKDISKSTNYSASYINKLFRENFNTTPHQYLLYKKLNESKKALSNGMRIQEACDYAGFTDYANFITSFRKVFGITPKKYIASLDSYTSKEIGKKNVPAKSTLEKEIMPAKKTNPHHY